MNELNRPECWTCTETKRCCLSPKFPALDCLISQKLIWFPFIFIMLCPTVSRTTKIRVCVFFSLSLFVCGNQSRKGTSLVICILHINHIIFQSKCMQTTALSIHNNVRQRPMPGVETIDERVHSRRHRPQPNKHTHTHTKGTLVLFCLFVVV